MQRKKPKEQKEKEFYLFSVFIFITANFISSDLMGDFFFHIMDITWTSMK